MKMYKRIIQLYLAFIFIPAFADKLPQGFTNLSAVDPSILQEMRYATYHNFIGRPIKGYEAGECILTKKAATALSNIQKKLKSLSLSLKVYDCYRPQMAVDDFIAWSKITDQQQMKTEFYPNVNKADFFKLGYVAEKSGHTRGSTVDLTIVTLPDKKEIDMGTHWDFMDERSHIDNKNINASAFQHRDLFRTIMEEFSFNPYSYEWWHFTLKNEPYPDTYFNFPITKAPKNNQTQTNQQLLVVGNNTLQRYQRASAKQDWKAVGEPIPVVIGKNGLAIGGIEKKEGDLKTPTGIYQIGPIFGFSANPDNKSNQRYLPISESTVCVDDPASSHYNQIVEKNKIGNPDWKSGEIMRQVPQYKMGAVISYNTVNPTQGAGSCIFLHIWKDAKTATAGCVAMDEKDLKTVLSWLREDKHPEILIKNK